MTSFSLANSFSGKVEQGDVGKEVEAALVMLFEEGGLKAGLFFGGEGVEVAAYVVKTAQDVVGLTVLRALEDGMFHKVGESVLVGQFITCTGFYHQHQMCDFALFFLMYQPNTVWKDGFGEFVFLHHLKIGLQRYDKRKTFLTLRL